jgi:hypothetical protein
VSGFPCVLDRLHVTVKMVFITCLVVGSTHACCSFVHSSLLLHLRSWKFSSASSLCSMLYIRTTKYKYTLLLLQFALLPFVIIVSDHVRQVCTALRTISRSWDRESGSCMHSAKLIKWADMNSDHLHVEPLRSRCYALSD